MNIVTILKNGAVRYSKTSYVTLFWLLLLTMVPDVIPKESLFEWVLENLQKYLVYPVVVKAVVDKYGEEVTREPLQSIIQRYQEMYEEPKESKDVIEPGQDERFLDSLHCEGERKRGYSLSSERPCPKVRCIPQIEPKLEIVNRKEHDLLINMVITISDYKDTGIVRALPERLNPLCFIQLCFLSPSIFLQNYRPFLYINSK